eukprot:gnl/Hemi2/24702_TR8318_c0_g1_i1.p1 gnl/Hemi2/24702_TR8318_c0_g1~~gnl/Hemi2/24702_TR8318_c0_g1_i1.p1  ORF type:complete len:429 (-),score=147.21 gnl/Hemi2/24702_TR8318_c0_g1_i1:100-1386(-)
MTPGRHVASTVVLCLACVWVLAVGATAAGRDAKLFTNDFRANVHRLARGVQEEYEIAKAAAGEAWSKHSEESFFLNTLWKYKNVKETLHMLGSPAAQTIDELQVDISRTHVAAVYDPMISLLELDNEMDVAIRAVVQRPVEVLLGGGTRECFYFVFFPFPAQKALLKWVRGGYNCPPVPALMAWMEAVSAAVGISVVFATDEAEYQCPGLFEEKKKISLVVLGLKTATSYYTRYGFESNHQKKWEVAKTLKFTAEWAAEVLAGLDAHEEQLLRTSAENKELLDTDEGVKQAMSLQPAVYTGYFIDPPVHAVVTLYKDFVAAQVGQELGEVLGALVEFSRRNADPQADSPPAWGTTSCEMVVRVATLLVTHKLDASDDDDASDGEEDQTVAAKFGLRASLPVWVDLDALPIGGGWTRRDPNRPAFKFDV